MLLFWNAYVFIDVTVSGISILSIPVQLSNNPLGIFVIPSANVTLFSFAQLSNGP